MRRKHRRLSRRLKTSGFPRKMIFKCWEKPTIFLDLYRGASYAYAEMRLNAGCLKMGLWMAMATPEIDGHFTKETDQLPIGSMYAIYGNIYHQYTPDVSIYTIHGSYGLEHLSFSWQNAKIADVSKHQGPTTDPSKL